MIYAQKKQRQQPRLSNCYYCEVPMLETKLTRKKVGFTIILDCGKCIERPKKKVKLLKRGVDQCQQG